MAPFTAFDIVVLLIIGLAALVGLMRGFVTEILSLIAWVAAVFVLRLFHAPASALAARYTGSAAGGAILAYVLLFLVTFVSFRWIARNLGARTRNSVVGPFDRVLGLGFGATKGLIMASLLFLLVTLFFDVVWGAGTPKPEWLRASRTYPLLRLSSQAITDFIEERRRAEAQDGYAQQTREALDRLLESPEGEKSERPPQRRHR